MTVQTLTLSVTYVVIATAIHVLIVLLASSLQSRIATADRRRVVRRALSLALVAIAIWFLFSTNRSS